MSLGAHRRTSWASQVAERGPGCVLGAPSQARGDFFIWTWAAPSVSWRIFSYHRLLRNRLPDPPRTPRGRGRSSPPALGSRRGINIPAQVLLRGLLPTFPPLPQPRQGKSFWGGEMITGNVFAGSLLTS